MLGWMFDTKYLCEISGRIQKATYRKPRIKSSRHVNDDVNDRKRSM